MTDYECAMCGENMNEKEVQELIVREADGMIDRVEDTAELGRPMFVLFVKANGVSSFLANGLKDDFNGEDMGEILKEIIKMMKRDKDLK